MLSLHRTLSPRYLLRRRGRALLVVLSIALGVATLVATRALNESLSQAARSAVSPLAGVSDLLVSNGELGVPRALVQELTNADIPGLQRVQPLVLGRVILPELNNRSALLVGADLDGAEFRDNRWGVEAHLSQRPLLALALAYPKAYVGSLLATQFPEGLWEFKVRVGSRALTLSRLGTVDAHGPAAALGGSAVFMRLADAADVLGRPDLVTRIDLSLAPGANLDEVRRQVQRTVGDRAEVRTPKAGEEAVNDVLAGVKLGFSLGGVCALVVGLFLVYNALSVSVAERRHDIGILRSLGATRGQVATLFAGEAGLLGLLGGLLGVPAGWGMAYLAMGPFQQTLSAVFVPIDDGKLPPIGIDTVLLALVAGVATALLAALVPALGAAGEEPADAVRRAPVNPGSGYRVLHGAASLFIVLTGMGCIGMRGYLAPRTGTFGGMALILVGMLLSTPLLAAGAARLFQPVARLFLGVSARLAADNLTRSPVRTGLVVGALAAGVALLIQTAGVTASSEDAVLAWIDRSIAADLFVTAFDPVSSSDQSLTMGEDVGRLLESLPQVKKAVPVRFQRVPFRDKIVYLVAVDGAAFYDADRLTAPVPGLDLFPRLREPGTVLVSENFAVQHHVAAGDHIALRGPHGPIEVKVIGTLLDYSWNRGTVFMDRTQYKDHFHDDLVDIYHVWVRSADEQAAFQARAALSAAPQAAFPADVPWTGLAQAGETESPAAVGETIRRRWGLQESLFVQTRDELRDFIRLMIRRLYEVGYAQELVVMLVAALGVVTALLISILQRRRELGLLRAVGASRWQVLRSVLAEAFLLGVTGSLIGVLFGIPLAWYALQVIFLDEAGFTFALRIPWFQVGGVMALALLLALAAGLLPAVHAVRLRIADAIAHE